MQTLVLTYICICMCMSTLQPQQMAKIPQCIAPLSTEAAVTHTVTVNDSYLICVLYTVRKENTIIN